MSSQPTGNGSGKKRKAPNAGAAKPPPTQNVSGSEVHSDSNPGEDVGQKIKRRLARKAELARASRRRRKAYVQSLEEKVSFLSAKLAEYQARAGELHGAEADPASLSATLDSAHSLLAVAGAGASVPAARLQQRHAYTVSSEMKEGDSDSSHSQGAPVGTGTGTSPAASPVALAADTSPLRTFKAVFNDDLRRFTLKAPHHAFTHLERTVADCFHLDAYFTIKYRDEDGDFISIASDADLNEAFRSIIATSTSNPKSRRKEAEANKAPVLKVYVQHADRPSHSAKTRRSRSQPQPQPIVDEADSKMLTEALKIMQSPANYPTQGDQTMSLLAAITHLNSMASRPPPQTADTPSAVPKASPKQLLKRESSLKPSRLASPEVKVRRSPALLPAAASPGLRGSPAMRAPLSSMTLPLPRPGAQSLFAAAKLSTKDFQEQTHASLPSLDSSDPTNTHNPSKPSHSNGGTGSSGPN